MASETQPCISSSSQGGWKISTQPSSLLRSVSKQLGLLRFELGRGQEASVTPFSSDTTIPRMSEMSSELVRLSKRFWAGISTSHRSKSRHCIICWEQHIFANTTEKKI